MKQEKGFTLIELLVVIAIIALLMSVIMPSLQKAKISVEEVICRSNLRQYGMAGKMYLDDYDEMFPNAWNSIFKSTDPDRQCQWHDAEKDPDRYPEYAGSLWNYIGGGGKVHYCRTFARFTKSGVPHPGHNASIPIESTLFCYSMNAFLGGFEGTDELRVKATDVISPSEIFFFAEENGWSFVPNEPGDPVRYTSVLNDNALCGAPEHPYYPTAWTYPKYPTPSFLDSFGSFHKTTIQKRNEGMANAVFIDGHVELVDPEQTYAYTRPMKSQPPLHD